MRKLKLLVVDDEADVGEFVSAAAEAMGFECTATTDATTFLEVLTPQITTILADLMMPEMDGIELLRLLSERKCKASIILMSGVGKRVLETAEQLAQVLGLSIIVHLQKPFRLAQLEEILERPAEPAIEPTVEPALKPSPLDEELRSAIERKEFILHYQPQIEIATGRVVGLEALARRQHPKRGLIFPDEFIGRMEELGLIDELGWIVANRGMSEIGMFANSSGKSPMLSLNASVYSLTDLFYPDMLVSIAKKHGILPVNITIEITESGLIKELARTLDILTRLKMKQVKLSIDDFGKGYAMMQQLQMIPATELKIDKSLIQNIQGKDTDRILIQKTIEMAHELGMKVMGEGVETNEQLEYLRLNGCDGVQGYLFSRPLSPSDLLASRLYRRYLEFQ
ncbi:MAG: EAL domain-containing response regulator [Terracidiphilus sp.]|nr:EAL domain-containing response regulator [Terracidiphilus sp.]